MGDSGIGYELRPDGAPTGEPERYGEREHAEQAATAMLIRRPELKFVDVVLAGSCEQVSRITGARGPAPAEAEIDDLHRLPRGEPEL
jgi:hypothetical protein